MSRYDYELSGRLAAGVAVPAQPPPFYALLMAAMRRADSVNAMMLRNAFPDVWTELQARYDAPGGKLASDQ